MSSRAVWYLLGGVALVGVVAIVVLLILWRTTRAPVVEAPAVASGNLAVYAGAFPVGEAERLQAPRSVTVAGSTLYVTEPDVASVSVFRLDGRFVRRIEVAAPGQVYPVDVAVVGRTMYVVDASGARVLSLDTDGGATRRVARALKQPTAITADGDSLLIADALTGVWRFEPEGGRLQRVWNSGARSVFIGDLAAIDSGTLVTDVGGSRILKLAQGSDEPVAFGDRVNLPRGIAVDTSGRVWVADVFGGTVAAFDAAGVLLGDLEDEATVGPDSVKFTSPQGVAFSSEEGRLFVADSSTGQVVVFAVAR